MSAQSRVLASGIGVTLILTAIACGAGQVYKWVDEQGKTHYGDRPGGKNASTVPIRPGPADSGAPEEDSGSYAGDEGGALDMPAGDESAPPDIPMGDDGAPLDMPPGIPGEDPALMGGTAMPAPEPGIEGLQSLPGAEENGAMPEMPSE